MKGRAVPITPQDLEEVTGEDEIALSKIIENINSQIKQRYNRSNSSAAEFIVYPQSNGSPSLVAKAREEFAKIWHLEEVQDFREGGIFWRMRKK